MTRTRLLFAHPALERSWANKGLLEAVSAEEGISVTDLYEVYPDFHIDVKREQESLLEAERIVLQHPFYWYSTPSLVKEWFDCVLEYGWAYGPGGEALAGKSLLSVITTGGEQEAYGVEGYNGYSVETFLRPVEQTAKLCGMRYEEPLVFYGALNADDEALEGWKTAYRERLGIA